MASKCHVMSAGCAVFTVGPCIILKWIRNEGKQINPRYHGLCGWVLETSLGEMGGDDRQTQGTENEKVIGWVLFPNGDVSAAWIIVRFSMYGMMGDTGWAILVAGNNFREFSCEVTGLRKM